MIDAINMKITPNQVVQTDVLVKGEEIFYVLGQTKEGHKIVWNKSVGNFNLFSAENQIAGSREKINYNASYLGLALSKDEDSPDLAIYLNLDWFDYHLIGTPGEYEVFAFNGKIATLEDIRRVQDLVNKKSSAGGKKMEQDKLSKILSGLKSDGINAGYRVGSTQLVNALKKAIVAVLYKQGMDNEKVKAACFFLDSEAGAALISMILGMALPQLPEQYSSNAHVVKIGEELRINAMTTAGNAVIGELTEHLMPALAQIFAALPAEEQTSNISRVRLTDAPEVVEEGERTESEEEETGLEAVAVASIR